MSLIEDVVRELGKLPPGAVKLVYQLVRDLVTGALSSDDPQRYIERRAAAEAAHLASQAALDKALEKTR